MLNGLLKLNPKLFDADVKMVATRKGYGEGLLEAGKENHQVVALCCDLTESTQTHLFAEAFPERFVEMGIQEQSMASVASGMASMGKIPFISSYAMFSPGRNWEQIRTTICYNNANVKIVGAHAGISVGPDGGTHQALEDIAITRVIPNMMVFSPADAIEAKKTVVAMSRVKGPAYIRLGRTDTPVITTDDTPFEVGKAYIYFQSQNKEIKVGIIVTGPLLYNALTAARNLDSRGIGVKVLNLPTIKPFPDKDILAFRQWLLGIVTLEEHQVAGGMGSSVSEFLSEKSPIRMSFMGIHDMFGQSGKPEELIEHYGMGISSIEKVVQTLLN